MSEPKEVKNEEKCNDKPLPKPRPAAFLFARLPFPHSLWIRTELDEPLERDEAIRDQSLLLIFD